MAGFATLFEFALVGICVAIPAILEFESCVAWQPTLAGCVALGTGRGEVLAGERVACLGVIECLLVELGALPRGGVVALQAVGAQAALMVILVAGGARGAETHVGAIQVLGLQNRPLCRGDVLRGVAAAAGGGGVLSVQNVAGLGVVESLRRGIPMDHIEVFAVVIGVALDAGLAGRAGQGIGGVQAVMAVDLGGDFAMALHAAKGRRPRRDGVALGTVGGPVKALMRLGEGARRNLAMRHQGK